VWLYFLIAWFMPNTVELFARHHIFLPSKAFAAAMERATEARLAYRFNKRWALLTALTFTIGWFAISNLSPFLYFQF